MVSSSMGMITGAYEKEVGLMAAK
ncbi:hypothetical protein GH733_001327, partial [Mirounga leonina]